MLLALTHPSWSADLPQLSLCGKEYRPEGVDFVQAIFLSSLNRGSQYRIFSSHHSHMTLDCVKFKL